MDRPGSPPGIYFRLLLIGYFKGIDSERGIAWRAADGVAGFPCSFTVVANRVLRLNAGSTTESH
jgi:hypothetical protein